MKIRKCILIVSIIIVLLALLSGCSTNETTCAFDNESNYDEGYNAGYDDGYSAGYEEGNNENAHAEEGLYSFKIAIAELMYDKKHDIVKELLEYNQDGVEEALELEFATSDLAAIEKIVQEYYETDAGVCGICNKTVYLNEVGYIPKGMECAHRKCVAEYEKDKN